MAGTNTNIGNEIAEILAEIDEEIKESSTLNT